jgi:hypothetical protein
VTRAEARADVRVLIETASRVLDRADVRETLVSVTGLSREGVDLAIERALERDPSEAELDLLFSRVRPAEEVAVVLSANVFTASLRALVLARAAAPRVLVKASRRDPVLADALIDESQLACFVRVDEPPFAPRPGTVLHAYGRDETMRALAASTGLPVWAHGAGLGVAVVERELPFEDVIPGLVEDTVLFDQRGCLSPRLVLVEGDGARLESLARELFAALEKRGREVPRGELEPEERSELVQRTRVALLVGEVLEGSSCTVSFAEIEDAAAPVLFSPGRHLSLIAVRDLDAARRRLESLGSAVACVSSGFRTTCGPTRARWAPFGSMQRPRLDGPVDLRDVWIG